MSVETLLLWLFVGLVAGWLANAVVGRAFAVVGDIVVGIVGPFIGGSPCFVHRPPGPRNGGIPLSTDRPAPVSATT